MNSETPTHLINIDFTHAALITQNKALTVQTLGTQCVHVLCTHAQCMSQSVLILRSVSNYEINHVESKKAYTQ